MTPSLLMLCCCNIHHLLKFPASTVGDNINICCVFCVVAILAVFLHYRLCFCNIGCVFAISAVFLPDLLCFCNFGCVFAIFISLPTPPSSDVWYSTAGHNISINLRTCYIPPVIQCVSLLSEYILEEYLLKQLIILRGLH